MRKFFVYSAIMALALCSCGKANNEQVADEAPLDQPVEEAVAPAEEVKKAPEKVVREESAPAVKEISQTDAIFSSDEDVLAALDGVVFWNTDGKDAGASVAFRDGQFIHNDGVVRSVMTPVIRRRGDDRAVFDVHQDVNDSTSLDYVVTYYGRDNVVILDMPGRSCAFATAKDIENQ